MSPIPGPSNFIQDLLLLTPPSPRENWKYVSKRERSRLMALDTHHHFWCMGSMNIFHHLPGLLLFIQKIQLNLRSKLQLFQRNLPCVIIQYRFSSLRTETSTWQESKEPMISLTNMTHFWEKEEWFSLTDRGYITSGGHWQVFHKQKYTYQNTLNFLILYHWGEYFLNLLVSSFCTEAWRLRIGVIYSSLVSYNCKSLSHYMNIS